MKKTFFLLLLVVFSSVSVFPQINEILKRMEAHSKALRALRADITITKVSSSAPEKLTKEGTVKFVPAKTGYLLRIDSIKPAPEFFSIVNNQYLLYASNPHPLLLPNAGIAYTGTPTDAQKDLLFIFSILSNYPKEKWKSDYSAVSYTGQEKLNGNIPTVHLQLTPKTPKTSRKIELWVDGNGMPLQAKIIENANNYSMIQLGNLQKNVKISSTDFRIELPKGVRPMRLR